MRYRVLIAALMAAGAFAGPARAGVVARPARANASFARPSAPIGSVRPIVSAPTIRVFAGALDRRRVEWTPVLEPVSSAGFAPLFRASVVGKRPPLLSAAPAAASRAEPRRPGADVKPSAGIPAAGDQAAAFEKALVRGEDAPESAGTQGIAEQLSLSFDGQPRRRRVVEPVSAEPARSSWGGSLRLQRFEWRRSKSAGTPPPASDAAARTPGILERIHRSISIGGGAVVALWAMYRIGTESARYGFYRELRDAGLQLTPWQVIDLGWLNDFLVVPTLAALTYLAFIPLSRLVPLRKPGFYALAAGFGMLGVAYEVSELFVGGHIFDPLDLLAYALGAATTLLLVRWAWWPRTDSGPVPSRSDLILGSVLVASIVLGGAASLGNWLCKQAMPLGAFPWPAFLLVASLAMIASLAPAVRGATRDTA